MSEQILALCRAMGASQEELLLPLVQAVEQQLAGRLKEGTAPADCGTAFPLAAAMTVMDRLSAVTGGGSGGEVASFTAGDLTIRRENGNSGQSGKSLSDQAEEHKKQLADLAFDGTLKDAITAAKGRNDKAIRALLDVEALKASKDQTADIKKALEKLKEDSGYLFESEETPPPYAAGTGTGGGRPATGLDAIRAAAGLTAGEKK